MEEARDDDVRVNLLERLALRRVFEKKGEQVLWVFGFGRGWRSCIWKMVRNGSGGYGCYC